MSLDELRRRIDALDDELLALISRRAALAIEVARHKRKHKLPARDHEREAAMLARARGLAREPLTAEAAARAGCDLAEMDTTIVREAAALDAEVDQNQRDLEAAGHWGVPTMVFQGEPFFGQDRIDLLVWRLRQHGLRERG